MDWMSFVICLGACIAAGSTGTAFPPGAWYERLDKPGWTPPNWLFPLAWTVLYIAMALAAARVALSPQAGPAMALWGLQIALNTLWTPVFFGLRRIGGAVIVIAALLGAVAATTAVFFTIDAVAGWLFVPYLVWVAYAAALNISVWRRNPDVPPRSVGEAPG